MSRLLVPRRVLRELRLLKLSVDESILLRLSLDEDPWELIEPRVVLDPLRDVPMPLAPGGRILLVVIRLLVVLSALGREALSPTLELERVLVWLLLSLLERALPRDELRAVRLELVLLEDGRKLDGVSLLVLRLLDSAERPAESEEGLLWRVVEPPDDLDPLSDDLPLLANAG